MTVGPRQIISVGIDIGTTTTQVVFSQLTLMDVARSGQIPRIEINARKVLYQNPLTFTPLLDEETVDPVQLAEIVRDAYQNAGLSPSDVDTGAVIITGETARKKNADHVIKAISGQAGDFVVTVAGPHLESLIAGRGSGAAEYSRHHFSTVVNIDIGGGSANSAVFRQGKMVTAAAMNFGGRILRIDPLEGTIIHIAPPAARIIESLHLPIIKGSRPALKDLITFCDCMADLTFELIEGGRSTLGEGIYLTPPAVVSGEGRLIMFSGGIGYYIYHPIPVGSISEIAIHGDIGPLLADRIRLHPRLSAYQYIPPSETLRATVLGASSQMVSLSGSTIWTEKNILPLKNIPVVRPEINETPITPDLINLAIHQALQRWDINYKNDDFAISLELKKIADYSALVQIAEGFSLFSRDMPDGHPLIIIVQHDYAQVLGQTIKGKMDRRPLLVIDQVGLEEGDYIDIGEPMMDGRVVPLSVKTLVFYH